MPTITDKIGAQLTDAHRRAAAPRTGARRRAASTAKPPGLTPVGPQKRPNGQVYHPRTVAHVEDLAFLRDAREHGEHTLLAGPPGTGKSAMAEAAFAQLATGGHHGLETIVGTADTVEADFLGSFVQDPATGTFTWSDGPLTRSVKAGIPLLVDEVALIEPRVLTVLYPLMDGRGELAIPANPRLDPIPVAQGWAVIGAYNPDVPGSLLSEALLSRFAHHIYVTTDWDLAADLGVPIDLITVARNLESRKHPKPVRKSNGKAETPAPTYAGWVPQMRDALLFADTEKRYGTAFAVAGLLRKCPDADRDEFMAAMTAKYPDCEPLALGGRARSPR